MSSLSLGTMTFGGKGRHAAMGALGVEPARRLVDMAIERGITLFDTADIYSEGFAEEVLGATLKGRRQGVQIATKAFSRMGPGPNDLGLSRQHLISACEASLRRLGTDYIDLYQAHSMDSITPMEETLGAFDTLVRQGKVSLHRLLQFLRLAHDERRSPFPTASVWHAISASRSNTRC